MANSNSIIDQFRQNYGTPAQTVSVSPDATIAPALVKTLPVQPQFQKIMLDSPQEQVRQQYDAMNPTSNPSVFDQFRQNYGIPAPAQTLWGDSGQPLAKVFQDAPAASSNAPMVKMPELPQSAPPKVTFAAPAPSPQQQQIAHDQQTLQKVQWAQENPWGTANNHPGKLGKLAHAFSELGNVAGDIFAPREMELIPGTQLNRQMQEGSWVNRLNSEIGQESENEARNANTAHAVQETAQMPEELKQQMDTIRAGLAEHGLQMDDTTGKISPVSDSELSPALRAQLLPKSEFEALQREHPNWTAEQVQNQTAKPLSKEQADALNQTWNAIAQQYHLPQDQFREGMASADASALSTSLNSVISRGQGQQKITVQTDNQGSARTDRAFQYNNGELDKLSNPLMQLQQRMGTLQSNLAQGSPQADALVAPELLSVMAGGQGSGLRMNEAEISRIVGGRSQWQDLKAAAQRWSLDPSSANSITPEQRQQIHALVNAVNTKIQAKQEILNGAYGDLLETDDPREQRQIVAGVRQKLSTLDEGGAGPSHGVKLSDAMSLPENKGKSEEDVIRDIESHGYQVIR
jgi:hypothetical protein